MAMARQLRVFTFAPDWGLPTTGPFALKLLAWLGANGIEYEQVIEMNPAKGPRGKSPWAEIDGETVSDSDLIIARIAAEHGVELPQPGDSAAHASAFAFKTAFEEGMHQILEWELFVHPEGTNYVRTAMRQALPPLVSGLAFHALSRTFRKQLRARGIARHEPERIAAMGCAMLDGLETWLRDGGFPRDKAGLPLIHELAVLGQVAPLMRWPMDTPVATHAARLPALRDWVEDTLALCFGAQEQPAQAAAAARSEDEPAAHQKTVAASAAKAPA